MEGSDETGVMQRIHSSYGNCSSSVHKQSDYQLGINGQMQNLSVLEGISNNINSNINNSSVSNNSFRRSAGIPPSYPHSNFGTPKMAGSSQNYSMGPTHSRSLSQSSFFSFDHLPPLSPTMIKESAPPISSSNELPTEEKDGGFRGGGGVHVNEGRPPRRGHRRSNSDVPLGVASSAPKEKEKEKDKPAQLVLKQESDWGEVGDKRKSEGEVVDDLFSAYMNMESIDALNSSSLEDKDMDSRASGTRTNDSSENEVESSIAGNSKRGKRSAAGEVTPTSRHYRSLSMDSFMGGLTFSDESPKLPPSPGIRSAHHSPSSSFDGNTSKFSLEFATGDFSPAEMKKIMASDKLAEIAMSDPKRVKRILANRQSAARSKERKLRYISELEHKVQTLQTEATTLSAQLTLLQRDSAGLTSQNNELKFRLQSMEQQAQLRDALNEALTAEVQRLKLMNGEHRGEAPQQAMTNNQMLQMQYMYQLQQQQSNQNQQQTRQQTQEPQQSQSMESQQDSKALKS